MTRPGRNVGVVALMFIAIVLALALMAWYAYTR
jgi:hypothetical protein